ncbi:MAG: 6,7-dimethyl-8-ribityllumazine synthase [Chloroflexi bacterium]|nr:6,7-dimethyl-8-ribityllumazine synthase [Chloroflexota bacterium]
MREFRGSFQGQGLRCGIVVSRFNELITSRLLDGARDALLRHGVRDEDITVAWTPGAFDIPLVAKQMAESRRYNAIICLGAVVRGETPHFDYVAGEAAKGIASVELSSGIPVLFGVLTTDSIEQAMDRAGAKVGNKGFDAAVSAIEMVNLLRDLAATPARRRRGRPPGSRRRQAETPATAPETPR